MIQVIRPSARLGGTISEITSLSANDWSKELSSGQKLLLIGKSSCQACAEWKKDLSSWKRPDELIILEIKLDQSGFGNFKRENPWITEIQILPYNVIFNEGVIVERWSGKGIERLENKLHSITN